MERKARNGKAWLGMKKELRMERRYRKGKEGRPGKNGWTWKEMERKLRMEIRARNGKEG